MQPRFAGKVALVTGATTGIGQATAVRLASEGAIVAVNQRPTGDPTQTLKMIKDVGGEAFPVVADMRDPVAVKAMVQETAKRGGRLDYIVSNAAINPFMPWDGTSIEDFDKLFETNVRGTWVVCTEGARQMIAEGHGGAIVMIGIPLVPFLHDVSAGCVKEARIEHVFRYAHVFPRCIAMLGSGAIDVSPLITETFGFDQSKEAFELAARAPQGSVKIQIEMPA